MSAPVEPALRSRRAQTGARNYRAGLAAEAAVAERYLLGGATVAARRWRSPAGEIDLVLRQGEETIFVEIKRARDFATAAARLGARQLERVRLSAEAFLGAEAGGPDRASRIDVALVDGSGAIEIIENAAMG